MPAGARRLAVDPRPAALEREGLVAYAGARRAGLERSTRARFSATDGTRKLSSWKTYCRTPRWW
jgi:hypothetical protein